VSQSSREEVRFKYLYRHINDLYLNQKLH